MEEKICPRCGKPGSGPHERPVGAKGKTYKASYFAHSGEHEGKTHRQKWCYLTQEMLAKMEAAGRSGK